jgi:protease-4
MLKFLLGLLSGVILVLFAIGLVFLLLVFAAGSADSTIADDSVLQIQMAGGLPEHVAEDVTFASLQGQTPVTLLMLLKALENAAADDRIKALELRFDGLGVGWAKAQELRWAVDEFRESGKPVYAYLNRAGMLDYYVASVADDIRVAPEAVLDVKGLRAEVMFYKDFFDKVGVDMEMERIGRFKSGAEPYSRSGMTDEFRFVLDAMLDGYIDQFLSGVAERRGLTPEGLRVLLDEGPFLPERAEESGLVDGIAYPDELNDLMAAALDVDEVEKVSLHQYIADGEGPLETSSSNRVAVLYGVGTILKTSGGMFGSDAVLASTAFNETVRELRADDSIDAVILRIDSPGGDATASDDMWRELNLLAAEKPVVVSMSDVAASGGYYMAMIENAPIVAYPGTITGSIGVYFGKLNLRGLYDKVGLRKEVVSRGKFAAIDSDYLPLGDEGRAKLREGIERVYRGFVTKVADARGAEYDAIDEVAQGRVWLGTEALENGLIDELGGFDRAIELAKEKANIDENESVSLVVFPKTKNLLDVLLAGEGLPAVRLSLSGLELPNLDDPRIPALLEGGMMALTPYSLTVQ